MNDSAEIEEYKTIALEMFRMYAVTNTVNSGLISENTLMNIKGLALEDENRKLNRKYRDLLKEHKRQKKLTDSWTQDILGKILFGIPKNHYEGLISSDNE